jgi:hypothetical protein
LGPAERTVKFHVFAASVGGAEIEPRRGGTEVSPGRSRAESWVKRNLIPEPRRGGTILLCRRLKPAQNS